MGAKQKVITVLAILVLALSASTVYYRGQSVAALDRLNEAKATAEAVSLLIDELVLQTAKRIESAKRRQEERDREALAEIERLTSIREPVRVRVESCESGPSASRDGEGTHQVNRGSEAQAHGILPHRNSERLREVIEEMELVNAAYASCRNLLLGD